MVVTVTVAVNPLAQGVTHTQPQPHNRSTRPNDNRRTTNTQPEHTTTNTARSHSHNAQPQHTTTTQSHKHTTATMCGRWSQGSTFGCQLETLATPRCKPWGQSSPRPAKKNWTSSESRIEHCLGRALARRRRNGIGHRSPESLSTTRRAHSRSRSSS